MNPIVKKFVPHLIAVAVMIALTFTFFSAYTFNGKVLQQGDNQKAGAIQTEITKYNKETGQPVLWTNALFSGMPTTQIYQVSKGNLTQPVFRTFLLGNSVVPPHTNALVGMLCMYLLLLTLRVDWRIALAGAVSFGLCTFNMDIIEAGHSTKAVALGFAPLVLAGAVLAFRGQWLRGGGVFALGVAMQLYANHFQITYYTFIILLVFGIVQLVSVFRTKAFPAFGLSVLSLIVGTILGVLSNMTAIWTTNEYQTETIRGKTELSNSDRPKEGGLDQKYAFDWSYGVGESFTLLAQNALGGGASQTHESTELFDKLRPQIAEQLTKNGVPADQINKNVDRQISGLFYTGDQPYLGVSIYWGAIAVFLFILGLFLIKDNKKWWLGIATLVMLMIAWGKNFFFAPALFDFFPLFNKFRAVTQALGLGQLLVIVLGMMSLQEIFNNHVNLSEKRRALIYSTCITVLLCLIAIIAGGDRGAGDAQLQQNPELLALLKDDRASLAQTDVMRSIGLILVSAGLIWFYLQGRIKSIFVIAGIGILMLLDTWTMAKRILNADKFETPKEAQAILEPKPADKMIMADKDPDFRVLDLRAGSPFTNAMTSNFHKSVGGYHAAKLMKYQELTEKYLGDFQKDKPIVEQKNMPLYGMLNAKYIILSDDIQGVQPNPYALGNAWFVENLKIVDNADAELDAVGKINPRKEAVIQKQYATSLNGFMPQFDSTATIKMTSYNPDKMEYAYSAKADQFAVFSEIYYPQAKGWNITIDGQLTTFTKVNYVLRGAKLPAGTHKLVMSFAPKSYYAGETISYIASALTLLAFFGGLFWYYRKNKFEDADRLELADSYQSSAISPQKIVKADAIVEVPKTTKPVPTVPKKLKKK